MKKRMMRALKLASVIIAVMILGMCYGLVASASGVDIPEGTIVLETERYETYSISPEGYQIGEEDVVSHTGAYLIYGEANSDVSFISNEGASVTYDVIIHNWTAKAQDWYGLIGIEKGVTLNITVIGNNVIKGYNHPGIKLNEKTEPGENPVVNLSFTENSSLTLGYLYEYEDCGCIGEEIAINLSEGTESSLDMSSDSWRGEREVTFFKGTGESHKTLYTYIDENYCRRYCSDCDLGVKDIRHEKIYKALSEEDENYALKHTEKCETCAHEYGLYDHDMRYTVSEVSHIAWCNECDYSGDSTEHSFDEDGCTVCGREYIASFDDGEQVSKYLTFNGILSSIDGKSGTLKLLNNIDEMDGQIPLLSGEITVDLSGYALEGVTFYIENGAKVSIIDSSEEKTGEWITNTWDYTYVKGEFTLDGISIRGNIGGLIDQARLIMKDVTVKRLGTISVWDESTAELTNVVYNVGLFINTSPDEIGGLVIKSGSFNGIKINTNSGDKIAVNQLLMDGYAYSSENGIIDGSKNEIIGLVSIVPHDTHNDDVMHYDAVQHWAGCACGYHLENVAKEIHTFGDDGACEGCHATIHMAVNDGSADKYFADAYEAFVYAEGLENSTIKLLCDSILDDYPKIMNNALLDLNGYTLELAKDRIYIYGSLTITDSSVERTGVLTTGEDDFAYAIQLQHDTSLTVNGGEIFGLIYNIGNARIEINDGRFTGIQKFRMSNGLILVINDGRFENIEGTLTYWASSGIEVTLNGGTFVDTTLVYEYSNYFPTVEELLGKNIGCELVLADEKGNELEAFEPTFFYAGGVTVAHKGSSLTKSEKGHALYCSECETQTATILHRRFNYLAIEGDSTNHAVFCGVCEYKLRDEKHSGGVATCQTRADCDLCGSMYGDFDPDNHTSIVKDDEVPPSCDGTGLTEGTHCEDCNETVVAQEVIPALGHTEKVVTGKAASCTESGLTDGTKCSVCDKTLTAQTEIPPTGHKYDNACDATCNVCEGTRTPAEHIDTDENQICDECAAELPKDGLSGGAIAGIAVGSTAAVGVSGFSLFWFVIKKKKWSDLVGIFKK